MVNGIEKKPININRPIYTGWYALYRCIFGDFLAMVYSKNE